MTPKGRARVGRGAVSRSGSAADNFHSAILGLSPWRRELQVRAGSARLSLTAECVLGNNPLLTSSTCHRGNAPFGFYLCAGAAFWEMWFSSPPPRGRAALE